MMDLTLPPRVTPRAFERLAEINADAEGYTRAVRDSDTAFRNA